MIKGLLENGWCFGFDLAADNLDIFSGVKIHPCYFIMWLLLGIHECFNKGFEKCMCYLHIWI